MDLHDLLLKLGDLSDAEIAARSATPEVAASVSELLASRRAVRVRIAGESRAHRCRVRRPLSRRLRHAVAARTRRSFSRKNRRPSNGNNSPLRAHPGPFTTADIATRYQLQPPTIEAVLRSLHSQGKLLEGEFRPNGHHREWCDPEVLRQIRRKSLARLRREIEPVEQSTFVRFTTRWQGVTVPRRGLDALLDTLEALQGSAILASELETEILPARIADYHPSNLDTLMAAGEVTWVGVEQIGDRNGRIALYLTESLPLLRLPD